MMCPSPMMMGPSSGGKAAFLLIALALGYWVLTLADSQGNPLKGVGRVVGWIIMIVAAAGLLCSAACGLGRMRACRAMQGHAMMGGCDMGMMGHPDIGDQNEPDTEKTPPGKK